MLKITPYLGIIVLIVSVFGIWYPVLGYFLVGVFLALLLISPFKGRWFCGNLCPRGSFHDFWLGKISLNKKIPGWVRSMWLRVPILILLMGLMVFRIVQARGLFEKVGMVFVTMCIVTTAFSIFFGVLVSPRTWCTLCPMGTVQRWFGKDKMPLKVDKDKCVKCGICNKVCPMGLPVSEITHHPDCIKCGRCVEACPKDALSF